MTSQHLSARNMSCGWSRVLLTGDVRVVHVVVATLVGSLALADGDDVDASLAASSSSDL